MCPNPLFAELNAKSNFSFLEGASHPEEMVQKAHELGYQSLAITDRNGVYGIVRAHAVAKELSFKLLIGAEISIDSQPLVLLAKHHVGYGNLCEILSQELFSWDFFETKKDGLFAILPVDSKVEPRLPHLKDLLGDSLRLLAFSHLDGSDKTIFDRAAHYSRHYGILCVASNRPLFHAQNRKQLQDVLTCIQHTIPLSKAGLKLLPNRERYLKPVPSIAKLFHSYPQWIENTLSLSEKCTFSLDELSYQYPTEWIPMGETGNSYLERLVWEGAAHRYGASILPAIQRQLKHELCLIRDLCYADYFLTIWDIVQYAKSKDILCQGRGSAANSTVCYVLGITAIDPIRMELLFERFISRERKEPPDIDIDFEHERREEVIQYIYTRYGRHRAAITAEVICFRKRSALREVAKAFEIPTTTVESILVETHRKKIAGVPHETLASKCTDIPKKKMSLFLSLSKEILGFPRHIGTHVGGFVLCQEPLSRNVPIEKAAMAGRTIVQWDKNDLDTLGFVRVDILGLGILTAIRKSFELVQNVYHQSLSLSSLPAEDSKVYTTIQKADTIGVFQIESRAQMNMLPRLRPQNFFDLVVEISLVRPGPIQGEMVHPYLRRRSGKESIEYAHPELEAILKKTYGIPLFQEQIMKMAMQVANFTGGEADELRRAMGSWRRDGKNRLTQMGENFRKGLVNKGVPEDFAERIFNQIEGFAEYGFPESHAASFAILAYATAWLKVYYPDVFVTSLLNSQPMGFYSAHTLIHDAERHGVFFRPIDVRKSTWDHQLEGPMSIRLGYRQIRGLSRSIADTLSSIRNNPHESFLSYVEALKTALFPKPLTKRDLFYLASANAFESLGLYRRQAFWNIQALSLQDSEVFQSEETNISLPQESAWEKISTDFDAQGISLFAHPIAHLRSELNTLKVVPSSGIKTFPPKKKVKVCGLVVSRQMPPTASGVLFITLEDEEGFINLVVWKKVFEQFRETLITSSFLFCEGTVQKAEDVDVTHVIVDTASSFFEMGRRIPSHDFR